jgi:hypothetical protein
MTIYNVKFTNRSKPSIYVNDDGYNTQTPITMFGRNTLNYGTVLWTNLLQYMEHYANSTPPNHAVEGQLWYDTSSTSLKINTGKITDQPVWENIIPRTTVDLSKILKRTGGTLPYDLLLTDPITEDTQFATKAYVDANTGIKFTSKNSTYQYNIMDFSGFITLNGVVAKNQLTNDKVTIDLPVVMKNTNYSVIITVNSKNSTYTSVDDYPRGHHYTVSNKTTDSFIIRDLDGGLPIAGELQFCLVGLILSSPL